MTLSPLNYFRLSILLALLPLPLPAQEGEWIDSPEANAVIGQADFDTTAPDTSDTALNAPADVSVDPATGAVFVADADNHRVLRFPSIEAMSAGEAAEMVFGQVDFDSATPGSALDQMDTPLGVFVDHEENLWVADSGNDRILRFDDAVARDDGSPEADGALGGSNPEVEGEFPPAAHSMAMPWAVTVDALGTLWVADSGNNRVLRFASAAAKEDLAEADGVLGQPDFVSSGIATTRSGMDLPLGVAVRTSGPGDAVELWVSDSRNHRVLRFDNAGALVNGADAAGVLGQPDFTTRIASLTRNGMQEPGGLALSPEGDLWVANPITNRVLRFVDAAQNADGADADNVIGQEDFESSAGGTGPAGLQRPEGLSLDGMDNLFVVDAGNHRVLRHSPELPEEPEEPEPPGEPEPEPKADPALPDLTIGLKRSEQKGEGIRNESGQRQKFTVKSRGFRSRQVRFFLHNRGSEGVFRLIGTKSTARVNYRYFSLTGGRSNITGQVVRGDYLQDIPPGGRARFLERVGFTSRARRSGRKIRQLARFTAISQTGGETDRVITRVIARPWRWRR